MADLFDADLMAHLNAAMPEDLHPTLQEMAEQMYLALAEDSAAASALGLPRLAEIVVEQLDRVALHAGGSGFYLPKGVRRELSARDREIVTRHNGRNKRELAREYGLSEMRIDQIMAAWRKMEFARRQGRLPLDE